MPSMAGQLAHARNSARISPSFRDGGEGNIMPPTGMMRPTKPEEEPEAEEPYTPPGYTPRTPGGGGGPTPRGTMGMPTGAGGLAAMPDVGAQLNPLQKPKMIAKVLRSLSPDQWMSWLSLDSWKDPMEIGLRLSILKIAFWVGLVGLIIVIVMGGIAYAKEHPIGTAWELLTQ